MIDISKFLIISQDDFETILTGLNCSLTISDKEYFIAYLFTNFFAYFLIIFVIVISLKIYKSLRRRVFNAKLI